MSEHVREYECECVIECHPASKATTVSVTYHWTIYHHIKEVLVAISSQDHPALPSVEPPRLFPAELQLRRSWLSSLVAVGTETGDGNGGGSVWIGPQFCVECTRTGHAR